MADTPTRSVPEIYAAIAEATPRVMAEQIAKPEYSLHELVTGLADDLRTRSGLENPENVIHTLARNKDLYAALEKQIGADTMVGYQGIGNNAFAMTYEDGGKTSILRVSNLAETATANPNFVLQPSHTTSITSSHPLTINRDTSYMDLADQGIIKSHEADDLKARLYQQDDIDKGFETVKTHTAQITRLDPAIDLQSFVEQGVVSEKEALQLRDAFRADMLKNGVYLADDHLENIGIKADGKLQVIDAGAAKTLDEQKAFIERMKTENPHVAEEQAKKLATLTEAAKTSPEIYPENSPHRVTTADPGALEKASTHGRYEALATTAKEAKTDTQIANAMSDATAAVEDVAKLENAAHKMPHMPKLGLASTAVVAGAVLFSQMHNDASAMDATKAAALATLDGMVPGSADGFKDIRDSKKGWIDRSLAAADTATGTLATTAGITAAVTSPAALTGIGASVPLTAGAVSLAAATANLGVGVLSDATHLVGLSERSGPITALADVAGKVLQGPQESALEWHARDTAWLRKEMENAQRPFPGTKDVQVADDPIKSDERDKKPDNADPKRSTPSDIGSQFERNIAAATDPATKHDDAAPATVEKAPEELAKATMQRQHVVRPAVDMSFG